MELMLAHLKECCLLPCVSVPPPPHLCSLSQGRAGRREQISVMERWCGRSLTHHMQHRADATPCLVNKWNVIDRSSLIYEAF